MRNFVALVYYQLHDAHNLSLRVTFTEIAPAPKQEIADFSMERFPCMSVPGFERLKPDRQSVYMEIPPDKFHLVRSALEREISKVEGAHSHRDGGQAEVDDQTHHVDDGGDEGRRAHRRVEPDAENQHRQK